LRSACLNNRSDDARTEFLNWAKGRWPNNPPANLADIGSRIPALQPAITQLEQALYDSAESQWDGNVFWDQFKAHRRDKQVEQSEITTQLEPLFKA
jgi:hypothetical protein